MALRLLSRGRRASIRVPVPPTPYSPQDIGNPFLFITFCSILSCPLCFNWLDYFVLEMITFPRREVKNKEVFENILPSYQRLEHKLIDRGD